MKRLTLSFITSDKTYTSSYLKSVTAEYFLFCYASPRQNTLYMPPECAKINKAKKTNKRTKYFQKYFTD